MANQINKKNTQVIGQWVESLALLGAYTNSLDKIQEAEQKIKIEIQKSTKIPELWYAYGSCLNAFGLYYSDNEYDFLAVEKFKKALSLDSTNPEILHALASTYMKIGKTSDDIAYLNNALKFYLRAIDFKPSCSFLNYDYGNLLLTLGELKEDQKTLEEALFYLEDCSEQSTKNSYSSS